MDLLDRLVHGNENDRLSFQPQRASLRGCRSIAEVVGCSLLAAYVLPSPTIMTKGAGYNPSATGYNNQENLI